MASLGPISPLVRNPTVGYRLDPGEPGVARPASASNSAYTVVGQESRNRARLKAEAIQRGDEVLLVKTDYKVARVGSFNVVVGGLTTVVSRNNPEASDEAATLSPTSSTDRAQPAANQKIVQLSTEELRLEREQRELEADTDDLDPVEKARATARLVAVEQRLREIESELRDLGVTPGATAASPAATFAANGLSTQLDATGRLLDLVV